MRRCVYALVISAGLFIIPASIAHAQQVPLQEQYLRIYLKINTAEDQIKNKDLRGALATFQDCYAKLSKIHRDNPDWETALVVHRMADCKAKIDDLSARVAALPPDTNPPPVVPPPTPPAPTGLSPTTNPVPSPAIVPGPDVTGQPVPDDVAGLKRRLAEVEAQLRQTKDTLRDSQTQLETYRARVETLNQQLQAVSSKQSVDDRAGKLLAENKSLLQKLNVAQAQLDDFKKNPKSRLAQVEAQLKNVQDQLDAAQSANNTLQQSLTTLQQRFDQNQAALVTANQKLAAIDPNSPDYATVKHENDLLRGMMQRELQEQARRDQAKRLFQEEFDALKIKSTKLQEEADNMAVLPFPPTTDEERTLLNSLKVTGSDIAPPPPGNNFAAPAAGSVGGTNAASGVSPDVANSALTGIASNGAMDDPSLAPSNAPAIKADQVAPAPPPVPTPTPAPAPAPTPTPTPAPPAPDSASVPPATNTPDAGNAPLPPDGVTPPAPAPTPSTPPDSKVVAMNSPKPPSPESTQPSNPPTVTNVPPGTTEVTQTNVNPSGKSDKQPDPTEWSSQARLPEDMRDTAQQASDFFSMKRYDDAAAKYQTIIDKYPGCLYAWSNLGVVRFQQGDLNDALKALQQAVKISPTDAFAYSNLGIVYYNLNQYENAIDALNAAKALSPKDAKIRNFLGCACAQKGWDEVAEKEFLAAIEIDPNFADAHFNLAVGYATQKPPATEMARREYDKALALGMAKDDHLEKLLQPKQ